jgi:glycosyltransferase involved in cell wall biosynthesis
MSEAIKRSLLGKKGLIIVPVFNEEAGLEAFYSHIRDVLKNVRPSINWDLLFIDDGSIDSSFNILQRFASDDQSVQILSFSRNFGKEVALSAALHHAKTYDFAVCMDADLQHPPELIPLFVEQWLRGADVVVGVRQSTEQKSLIRRFGSMLYHVAMAKFSDIDMRSRSTDFRLLDRKVIEAFEKTSEQGRLFRGIIDWMGFDKAYVEFDAKARFAGTEAYSLSNLWSLALTSLTSYSTTPLRAIGYFGFSISTLSLLLLCWMLADFVFLGVMGFTPLSIIVVANTFFMGLLMSVLGLIGLYIAKIHQEVLGRPLYLIKRSVNIAVPELSRYADN